MVKHTLAISTYETYFKSYCEECGWKSGFYRLTEEEAQSDFKNHIMKRRQNDC